MNLLIVAAGIRAPRNPTTTMTVAGLESAGHAVYGFDPYLATELYGWTGCQRLLKLVARGRSVDLVLTFPPYDLIDPATATILQGEGITVAGLRYDDARFLNEAEPWRRRLLIDSSAHCDFVGTTSQLAHDYALAHGEARMRLWPLPISPELYPQMDRPKRYPVTFVGSAMAQADRPSPRVLAVQALLAAGIEVRVWGAGWPQIPGLPAPLVGPQLSFEAMVQVIQESQLCLALPDNYHATPAPAIKLRNLEIASCGGVMVQEQGPDIDRLFRPGEEYLPYTDESSLVATVRQALDSPGRLGAIGRAAAQRVRRDYTWGPFITQLAGELQAAGKLRTPVRPADADCREALIVANLGLAHACELRGHAAMACGYFAEVLHDAPDDASAWAGLARDAERCQAGVSERAERWQRAKGHGQSRAYNLAVGPVLKLPGLGTAIPGDFVAEAAVRRFQALQEQGLLQEAIAEARLFAHHLPGPLLTLVQGWRTAGALAEADQLMRVLAASQPNVDS